MRKIRDIFHSLRHDRSGVAIIMTTMFLGTVGVLALVGLVAIGQLATSRAYVNGVARDTAESSVQSLVNEEATASGGGGVQLYTGSTASGEIGHIIESSTTGAYASGIPPGVSVSSNSATQIYNTPYPTQVNKQLAAGACPTIEPGSTSYYCWKENPLLPAGTQLFESREHFSSGVNIGLTANTEVPLLGVVPVAAEGSAEWVQSCVNEKTKNHAEERCKGEGETEETEERVAKPFAKP